MATSRAAPSWILSILISTFATGNAVLSDLDHHLLLNSSSPENFGPWISDGSAPSEHSQYIRPSADFVPSEENLFAKYHSTSPLHRNPHFVDLESHQKRIASFYHSDGRHDYRSSPPYQDHQALHSIPEYDAAPQKKHDFSGGSNYGGWDMFSGGLNFGSGFGQAGQAIRKGKEAKALFVLMAPLILMAVFGPFLATQAMIPWFTGGGLTSVSTVAGGKRRKRSPFDPRQQAELEKRLQLFLEVQDFIARTGSPEFAEEMGEAFLQCQRNTEKADKCLERIACEYSDNTSSMDPAERRIAKMVLQNIMSNTIIPVSIKGRLSKGLMFGKNFRGRCKNYWCAAVDHAKGKP